MEQNEFKPFEMWRDHFGLAEPVQSSKLRDEKLGDEEEIVSVPEKQPKYIQLQVKGKGRRTRKCLRRTARDNQPQSQSKA